VAVGGLLFAVLAAGGCRRPTDAAAAAAGSAAAAQPAPSPTARERPIVLFLGTSLTAGFGLEDPALAYPALIQERIDAAGLRFRVVNAGVSGETSAGALRRMDWLLQQRIAVLVLETGANDGLRGQDPDFTRANLEAIIARARRQQPPPRVVLAGMQALTNYGAEYTSRFRAVFPELARSKGVALVPFLLEGVAGVGALNQPDGIHPTAAGQRRIADNVWSVLRPVLEAAAREGP
jgi:acyl-CoA thioesterase-1